MHTSTLICDDDARREQVRARTSLNGLDYLDVSDDQLTLMIYFLGKAPQSLTKENFAIEGGQRVRGILIRKLELHTEPDPSLDDWVTLELDRYGDSSIYTLQLVNADGIDPFYDHLDFSFKVNCPSDLDCKPDDSCPPEPRVEPEINYLAKDYVSFRQLILDRLALILPDWKERHVPDLGIALVETLAYTGDQLSYYQDAVATEAYLDTARQRISVRRHARLVDYRMHEGCNARAWVCLSVFGEPFEMNLSDVYFTTLLNTPQFKDRHVLLNEELRQIPADTYEVFEAVLRSTKITLREAHNEILFHTWGNRECCLPRDATSAFLLDRWVYVADESNHADEEDDDEEDDDDREDTDDDDDHDKGKGKDKHKDKRDNPKDARIAKYKAGKPPLDKSKLKRALDLHPGDVLVFEETMGPHTGNPADADRSRRHAVRLTRVTLNEDQVVMTEVDAGGTSYELSTPVLDIEWSAEDALPFPLCLSVIGAAPECAYLANVSVARGNVILVDHGRTLPPEDLGVVPCASSQAECDCAGHPGDVTFTAGRFRPQLAKASLTYAVPFPQPVVIAEQQARLLATIMSRVESRVSALWKQARDGRMLAQEEIDELVIIFGEEAMQKAEQNPDGKKPTAWKDMDYTRQAAEIKRLVNKKNRWLGNKARRISILQARARTGDVLNDAASEITELFGAQYASGLEPDSSYALGPASAALNQDARQALPQIIELNNIPAAPATDCKSLAPLFRAADLFDLKEIIPMLRDALNPRAQVLRARLSSETLALLDQLKEGDSTSNELQLALIAALNQMLTVWIAKPDLLESGPDDRHFVVEVDNDGRGNLRFGDGELGEQLQAGSAFFATYRVGNGRRGNVGAETITHLVFRQTPVSVLRIRNPMPAQGGTEPEPMAEVKLFAPSAFRKELQRAVTADDYAQLVQRDFKNNVQGAKGALTWTGSWYEARVAVDPRGSEETDQGLLDAIHGRLDRYRRIGHDLAVVPARYVSLDIELSVCVKSGYLRGHVKAALLDVFSNRALPNGRTGFFHPDNLTFGEGVYLSQLIAAAQVVEGVESVQVKKLQRQFEPENHELENGLLTLNILEVARCDNDPNFPENGKIEIQIEE